MFLIKSLLLKACFSAGGGGDGAGGKGASFTVTISVAWRMNKLPEELGTKEVVETWLSNRSWASYFPSASFSVKQGL